MSEITESGSSADSFGYSDRSGHSGSPDYPSHAADSDCPDGTGDDVHNMPRRVRILSIAGTDPSGGAGLMADLRTFAALGAYGMGVITNVVAQNTQEVRSVRAISPDMVKMQLNAVSDDVTIDGIKIGMLGSTEIIDTVHEWLGTLRMQELRTDGIHFPVVLDPVMISTSGTRLLNETSVASLRKLISSGLIDVVTPNIPEMAALLDTDRASTWEQMCAQAAQLAKQTGVMVYAKSGHLEGSDDRSDAFVEWSEDSAAFSEVSERGTAHVTRLPGTRIATKNTHGTGCTLSSALATFRVQGMILDESWANAARQTKKYMNGTIAHADGLMVGQGHGPIDQLWNTVFLPEGLQ
ncbi:MAG: bifunctional hydroxymethylpyrimidine kinase/phosphomethylpyrimidine kinase [Bifidobacteriaceae bacterium]|nr:bifunctional hydroxymethylpyrimidine kinase/phosphomethylpyrimidine kinase [Bifidobacteriaceae bacterium]MCI1978927.1 bifunctional hydroxymethylpyrimidine kinase/phosphomethylpyrimidine kinase [Bifidobacteriaceae bacterium]